MKEKAKMSIARKEELGNAEGEMPPKTYPGRFV